MPRVPIAQNQVGTAAPGPAGGLVAADFGDGAGAGLKTLGAGFDETARAAIDINTGASKMLRDEALSGSNDLVYGPDGYRGKTGLDAVNGYENARKQVSDLYSQTLDRAANTGQRATLKPMLDDAMRSDLRVIDTHYREQGRVFDAKQSQASIDNSAARAASTYAADPDASEAAIGAMRQEVVNLAKLQGTYTPEIVEAETRRNVSTVRGNIVGQIAAGGPDGVEKAQSYLDAHRTDFTENGATSAQTAITTWGRHYQAQARADAADARRLARENEQDARQRVTTGLDTLRTGTPLPPDQMAKLEDDARASGAGADGLLFQVKQAGFKNTLNVEYRNAAPAQIGARVDELGAKIAKAGDHPDMQDVVEHDHLQSLQQASAAQLQSDPLAWGANHLGANVQPLNVNDASSIAQRVAISRSIAARTGAVPQYLKPEEASSWQQTVSHGEAAGRYTVAKNVLAFGAAAPRVLDQVAGNDPGFRAATGLASFRNGDTLMRMALSGADALKAAPRLLTPEKKPDGSPGTTHEQIFSGDMRMATALLPPSARAALLYNSTNLYAARASSSGFGEKLHPGEFQKSENYALGGRETSAGWVGGLGQFNNAKVVLPTEMGQAEFDHRLSRAGGSDWARASSDPHDPPSAAGRVLHAGELRSLVPVMVGDGRYALRQGPNSYITTQSGKRFEFDVRKLP